MSLNLFFSATDPKACDQNASDPFVFEFDPLNGNLADSTVVKIFMQNL